MKRSWQLALCLLAGGVLAAPVNVIFDTDIGPDCDDVGAVAVLHGLADGGEANLLAMMCCTSSPWGAPCLDALNTWFGRPDIPIGTLKAPGFLAGAGKYPEQIARRYPHDLASGLDAPDAVTLYRRVLAAQPEQSVVVAAVGPLPNLRLLLDSPPDALSPLDGRALVASRVTRLVCMGGAYPASAAGRDGEWNFAQDADAARAVAERWPTPIVFSGGEVGSGIMTGRRLALACPEYSPLPAAYGLYIGYGRDRESWDLTAALVAVRGAGERWPLSPTGTVSVGEKGRTSFTPEAAGRHTYLVRREPTQPTEDELEELMVSARQGPVLMDHEITLFAADGFGQCSAAGSEYGPETVANAFDRKPDTAWYAGDGESWVRFDAADGRTHRLGDYRVVTRDREPRTWQLQASADGGATWQTLDSQTNQPQCDETGPRTFRLANVLPCSSWRLRFPGGRKVDVAELALFETVEHAAGVGVRQLRLDHPTLRLPVAGRAALNVAVLPTNALDKQVSWTSSNPAVAIVKRIGDHTAMVRGVSPGACRVVATSRDGARVAASEVTVTAPALPAPWVYEEVNEPHVPGAAVFADGAITLTGGGMGIGRWWQRNWDQLAMVTQPAEGDCAVSARVGAPTRSSDGALAGVMLREGADRESRFVAVGVHPSGEAVLTWRDTNASENPRTKLGKLVLPAYLKIERRGDVFEVFASADGVAWGTALGRHVAAGHPARQRAGVWITADRSPTTSTARFEQVSVTRM